jgi:hypothetical protein
MTAYNRRVWFVCVALLLLPHAAAEAADVVFPPDAVVNVKDYGAIPDDGKDDTQAIQKAITDNVGTGRTIYFPAGTYDLSDSLVAKNKDGHWEAHLTMQGQGEDKTTLRLKQHAAGFDDPTKPKAVIMTGSHWEKGDSEDGGGNKAFRNNIRDLTILTGQDNPGAVGIDWAVSNQGTIRSVALRGDGLAAISATRRIPGPGYLREVDIEGFAIGIDISDLQYGITLEKCRFRKQTLLPLRLTNNLGNAIQLDAIGKGIETDGTGSVLVITHSKSLLQIGGHALAQLTVPKYWPVTTWQPGQPPHAETAGTLPAINLLPVSYRQKDYWNEHLDDWQPVGPRLKGEPDDTAAIQRAIDAGKPVVYFPIRKEAYFLGNTVTIRGKVRHVLGMGQEISLGAAKEPFSNKDQPRPLFRVDPVDGDDLTIENCFFNAQYPGEVIFENNSPKPLTIKHCMGWVGAESERRSYQNTPASFGGKVFIEDCFLPGWRFEKQDVWARQFNPENPDGDGVTPQVANVGGTLWILGFKTEGPAPFIWTSAGGMTELLGAYNYVSATAAAKVPVDAVPYVVEDSQASLTFATDNFRADSDYKVYIREIKNGKVVKDVTRDELPPRNGVKGDRSFVVTNWRTPPSP